MRIQFTLLVVTLVLAPAPTHATGSPLQENQQEQQETPCERAAIAIVEHATRFTERANNATNPFDVADGAAKACGVLLRGIKELSDKGCPQEIIDLAVDAQKESKEALDLINEKYSYRFSCFVPDFL